MASLMMLIIPLTMTGHIISEMLVKYPVHVLMSPSCNDHKEMPGWQFHSVSVLNTDKKQFRGDRIYLAYICRPQATNEGRQGTDSKQELYK